jgi:hypothetical protein
MKTTIEEINGKKYTMTTVEDIEQWEISEAQQYIDWRGVYVYVQKHLKGCEYIAAYALPALPRNPTADDAELLHLYAGNGLTPIFTHQGNKHLAIYEREARVLPSVNEVFKAGYCDEYNLEYLASVKRQDILTHAVDKQGNRIQIAIEEKV